jgi:hypothetical protein
MKLCKVIQYPLQGEVTEHYYSVTENGDTYFLLKATIENGRTTQITGPAVEKSKTDADTIYRFLQVPSSESSNWNEAPEELRKLVKATGINRISHWEQASVAEDFLCGLPQAPRSFFKGKDWNLIAWIVFILGFLIYEQVARVLHWPFG